MKFKFKEDANIVTDDFWYDIVGGGGYIKPETLLEDPEQLKAVQDAIELLQELHSQLEDAEIIEEM